MSKINYDSLTLCGTACSIAVPLWYNSGCQRVNRSN